MNDKTLSKLGIVAGVLIVLSIIVGLDSPTVEFAFARGRPLIADVDVGRVAKILVRNEGKEVSLVRHGREFRVESKLNYPANNREINELIRLALRITLESEVTADPANHEGLGVVEAGDKAKVLTFYDADGKVVSGFVVGNDIESEAPGGGGRYVRALGENTVYVTKEYVYLGDDPLRYVDKTLLRTTRDEIEKVEVAVAGDKSYKIESPEQGKIELVGIPEGKKAKGVTHETVFGSAANLSFSDLFSAAEMPDLSFDSQHVVTLRAGAEYTFEVAKREKPVEDDGGDENEPPAPEVEYFVRCSARYVGEQVTINPNEKDSPEELAEKEKKLESRDAAKAFAERHQSWIYKLSSWQAENLVKKFDELVEDDDGKPSEIAASHILIPFQGAQNAGEDVTRTKEEAKALAEELLARLTEDPSKFEELAKEHSSCSSKEKGGDLGTFPFEQMTKPFSEAAFALEVGATAEQVVETEFGYHIIKRTK